MDLDFLAVCSKAIHSMICINVISWKLKIKRHAEIFINVRKVQEEQNHLSCSLFLASSYWLWSMLGNKMSKHYIFILYFVKLMKIHISSTLHLVQLCFYKSSRSAVRWQKYLVFGNLGHEYFDSLFLWDRFYSAFFLCIFYFQFFWVVDSSLQCLNQQLNSREPFYRHTAWSECLISIQK